MKSDISNFFATNKNFYISELPEISSNGHSSNDEDNRNQVSIILKQEGADDNELLIFEYWVDGITKPKEIAKDLGIEVKEVYNITKRLERRLPKIQTQVENII